jgi:predicted GIY-YIG superfamily endonuclease
MDKWSVYLVRCRDDSLYAGIALDVNRRIEEHCEGKRGAKYNRSLALKVELRIKKLSRKAKQKLIENPKVIDEIALACQVGAS